MQEHNVESPNNMSFSNKRMLNDNAHHGYVGTRREQVRLQEEELVMIVMKEDALRGEKMKRVQELRVDELSVQNLTQSHETIHRLTSQVQELHERMNYVNASGELHEVESNYNGKISHVPKSTSKDSKSAFYAKLRQTLAT